jgi:hypothetical protein
MTLINVAAGAPLNAATINALIAGRANRPNVRLALTANQSIANITNTAILFGAGTEVRDVSGWHSTSANTSRVTPNLSGIFLCLGRIYWAASLENPSGDRRAYIEKNSGLDGNWSRNFPRATGGAYPGTGAAGVSHDVSGVVSLNGTTDYVELGCYQSSGVALNASGVGDATFSTTFDVIYLGESL